LNESIQTKCTNDLFYVWRQYRCKETEGIN
jgi:hypothetical protein